MLSTTFEESNCFRLPSLRGDVQDDDDFLFGDERSVEHFQPILKMLNTE